MSSELEPIVLEGEILDNDTFVYYEDLAVDTMGYAWYPYFDFAARLQGDFEDYQRQQDIRRVYK